MQQQLMGGLFSLFNDYGGSLEQQSQRLTLAWEG